RRLCRLPWLVGKPPGERLVTTVASSHFRLSLALRRTGLAGQAHMEMVEVPPVGATLAEPASVARHCVAKLLLDARMHKDALDFRIACGMLDEGRAGRGPL